MPNTCLDVCRYANRLSKIYIQEDDADLFLMVCDNMLQLPIGRCKRAGHPTADGALVPVKTQETMRMSVIGQARPFRL